MAWVKIPSNDMLIRSLSNCTNHFTGFGCHSKKRIGGDCAPATFLFLWYDVDNHFLKKVGVCIMKIAIVTDSTCYLPQTEIDKHHITVVPIPVILDGAVYDEGKDITTEEFYAKLKTAKTFPSTTQPPLGEMLKLYENLANEGYDTIISIHLASTISGLWEYIERCRR